MKFSVKRVFDIIASLVLIIIAFPLLILIGVLVRIKLGSPVLFRQERPGKQNKIFMIYKFRTMNNRMDTNGNLQPDKARLTRFGSLLRKTSMDELPELFNILKGDMSFVGPRPLLVQYLTRYNSDQIRRHEVRPGLTGWAQVNGRNAITWEEKFDLDVWYVDNWSLWLDLKIIMKTILVVLKRNGINAEGEATIGEFVGSKGDKN